MVKEISGRRRRHPLENEKSSVSRIQSGWTHGTMSRWHESSRIWRPAVRRQALAKAMAPIRATWRSTTEVNSSMTTRRPPSRRTRAKVARKRSPVERTWNGRSQDGQEPRPTAERAAATELKPEAGAISSMMGRSLDQRKAAERRKQRGPKAARPMVDLPEPDGPTIRPIFQPSSSAGIWTEARKVAAWSGVTLNNERTRAER